MRSLRDGMGRIWVELWQETNLELVIFLELEFQIFGILPRKCTSQANTLFQQHKRWYTCSSPNGQYQNQIYYILFYINLFILIGG